MMSWEDEMLKLKKEKCVLYAQGSNLQSCSNDGTLELLGAASPLLGHILLKTLLVLPGMTVDCENKDESSFFKYP